MERKKILNFVLCLAFVLSIFLNLYFLIPTKGSESISSGCYLSRDTNGISYELSIMRDNTVLLYGPKNDLLFEGKLEFVEKENYYLITTKTNEYQVAVLDDTVFLPIIENKRIISKLFKKVDNIPVTYEQ